MTNVSKTEPKHILFSVLNWGLGHATRSIPVISELLNRDFKVTIASDGLPLLLLKETFQHANFLELPGLEIKYSKNKNQLLAIGQSAAKNPSWFLKERKVLKEFLAQNKVDGIISDNRPTAFSKVIPSVYITHQLQVKAGIYGSVASFGHRSFFKNYNQIWVPDFEENTLAGDLSKKVSGSNIHYIGALSDLTLRKTVPKFDLGIILSGPEPQRTILEEILLDELISTDFKIKLIRGTTEPLQKKIKPDWEIIDLANRKFIQELYNNSTVLIARSGYSTLMDLYTLPKPAILIPTPNQPEQEYLASLPYHQHNFEIQSQAKFNLKDGIVSAKRKFQSFRPVPKSSVNFDELFMLF